VSGGLSTSWLAVRLGLDPLQVNRLRESGRLFGVRGERGEYVFPAWQFDGEGRTLPVVTRILERARAARVRPEQLLELLERPVGLVGHTRFLDLLLGGSEARVVAELATV
jgi:hypothetical protein